MNSKLIWRSFLFWFMFIPIAIINGSVRNFFYQPIVGDLAAHQISSVTFSFLFLLFTYFFIKTSKVKIKKSESLQIGIFWLFLTIIFEFGFGHFIAGNSWQKLLFDYNIFQGRVWFLVLMIITFSPSIIIKLLSKKTKP